MAPSFANMPPYARASFIAAQLERLSAESAARTANPAHVPTPDPSAKQPDADPTPKQPKPKKVRAAGNAKNILRTAKAITGASASAPSARRSFSGGGPKFIHHPPDIARHRRKCAVCHHPEREAIEDLFIHWHSPEAIASHYEEDDESITWISIYRHAYAFGLDETRRRNLRFVFEHILDQAGTTAATPASIIVAARALGSCVDAAGQWNDPPKRVLVTNIVKKEPSDSPSAPAAPPAAPSCKTPTAEPVGAASRRPRFDSGSDFETDGNKNPSFRAFHPREVVASQPNSAESVAACAPSAVCSTASPEIRNSPNSLQSNEPPISNR
jgi:hypothetical protein